MQDQRVEEKPRDWSGETLWGYQGMALSTADSNKWLLLKEGRLARQTPEVITSPDYQLIGSIHQQRRRLTEAQVIEMAARCKGGATLCELANEFACHRTTVSARRRKAGVSLRLQSPTVHVIDSMIHLYTYGLSTMEIGERLGFCANTMRNGQQGHGIQHGDTHGRNR
jgi:transposase-like protein